MARVSREQVFSALFALTEGVTWEAYPGTGQMVGLKTRERTVRLFSEVNSSFQPYLAQAEHSEDSQQVTGMPYKRVWDAQWIMYHRAGDNVSIDNKTRTPSIFTNQMIDAFEAAMAPKPVDPGFLDRRNTLSGLVHHCFIQGKIFKDPGDIDKQGMIVIPIKLLVP